MTKVTNIPGRLHSVEQGNIVAGANEVYDDTKGKKQNVINSETDAELLRLEQTKQDNLTFDNAPTENSNNPVKSGGVYAADLALQQAIEAILLLIPSAATSLNQLADKAFVNSSISTATATFRGTYNVVTDLHLDVDATHAQIETALASVIATADNNDYCFVQTPVSSSSQDIQKTSRYKFNGSAWVFEYDLNTSGFTSAQWAAINSGITAALATKLGDLPTPTELSTDLQALSTAIGSEETRAKGVEQGLSTAVQGILALIPSEATSSNKLADKTYVTNLINAITALIPAEATNLNQLADKAYVLAQILAATPAFKGQFETLAELQAVASPKAGDLGIVRTKDSDGYDVFTFYQYLNSQWNVFYTLSHHLLNKPATTGTTGDYPYNGMGRVVISKNMVGGINTLTQDAFEDSEGNPLTDTVFVIQYDFVLGEDIEIPANCVLGFDGGSLSNGSITFNNTVIESKSKCFNSIICGPNSTIFGNIQAHWFGIIDDGVTDNVVALTQLNSFVANLVKLPSWGHDYTRGTIEFKTKGYINISNPVTFNHQCSIVGFPRFYYNGIFQEDSGAIIIDNLYDGKVELSVVSSRVELNNNAHCDLSDGVKFGGVCLRQVRWCDIILEECQGFFAAIYLSSTSGANSTIYSNLTIRQSTLCLHLVYVYNTNSAWSNGNTIINSCMGGDSGRTVAPSGFEGSGLFTIAGDNSYPLNTWKIINCAIEGSPTVKGTNVYRNEQTVDHPCDVQILAIRLENNNAPIIYTHKLFTMPCVYNSYDSGTVCFADYNNLTIDINSQLCKSMGVISSNEDNMFSIKKYIPNSKKDDVELYKYDFDYARIHISNLFLNEGDNFGFTVCVKLSSKDTIAFDVNEECGLRLSSVTDSDYNAAITNGTIITKDNITFANKGIQVLKSWWRQDGSDIYGESSKITSCVLYNNSDNDYYIYVYGQIAVDFNLTIAGTKNIVFGNRLRGGILQSGTTVQRPAFGEQLTVGSKYKGFNFYDESINKAIWWNGTTWVDATGDPV